MGRIFVLAFAVFVLVGWAIQSNAAQTADVCPGFIAEAIETVGNNCGSLSRNNACYGYNTVVATFDQLPEPDYFTSPSDLADLFNLRTISTTPLRANLEEWGITLMSVQANLPDALPGQNVVFMLAGDVGMESAVDPATLQDPEAEQSPMQAFYFRTGIAQTDCNEAPDTLIVQGPRGVQVDFTANGADIRIGSTVALRTLTVDPAYIAQLKSQYGFTQDVVLVLELFVFDGEAILNPGTPDEVRVPQGYRALRCLNAPDNLGVDGENNDYAVFGGCPWVDIRPATDAEIQEFAGYEGMDLNYPIVLPDGTFIASAPTTAPVIPPAPTSTGIPPATTAATTVPPTATSTQPVNMPPEVMLAATPAGSTPRNNYYLNGTYNDPDDDTLVMTINWGDGSEPQSVILGGGEGGGWGGFARMVAGSFNVPHVYPNNGLFNISVTVQDGAGNQVSRGAQANVDALMPFTFEIESGDGQGALPDSAYPDPLVGKLLDAGGAPVVGYVVLLTTVNADTDAYCDGVPCYVVTDAAGHATVNAMAGPTPGIAAVTMEVADTELVITFNLTVSAGNSNAPTVDINTDQLVSQNGEPFTLDYYIDDPDGDLMSVAIYWGDSDTPQELFDQPSGAYFIDHEFAAVGTLTITVVVSDGELTDSDEWVLDVLPLYPLSVSHDPLGGWTGEVVGGNVYPGMLRVYVSDSENDPFLGAPLVPLDSESISPTTTLDTPGTGFADVTITADCESRETIRIGSPDPTAPYGEGDPGPFRWTYVSVNQQAPYALNAYDGDEQMTYAGMDFEMPLTVEVVDHLSNGVAGASITFTIYSWEGAEFTSGGTEYVAVSDSGGFAVSDTIRAGGIEYIYVEAIYINGLCAYGTYFYLTVDYLPGPVGPLGIDGAEATSEVILPESTAEVTDEPAAPEATDEPVAPEATDEPVAPEATDEPVAPEATDEVVVPPESTQEVILPEATEEAVYPVLPLPTSIYTPTATGTLSSPSAPVLGSTPTPLP